MVRALDEVSGGRVTLGLGSGSGPSDRRWTAFGFDATAHVSRFAEAVEIVARLVRDGPTTFDGRFYTIADPDIGPAGPSAGGPPIWVAGGKPRTMEVAARWGDVIDDHNALPDAAAVAAFRERAEVACATAGRDPASVTLTGWARVAPSPDGRLDADRRHGRWHAGGDRRAARGDPRGRHLAPDRLHRRRGGRAHVPGPHCPRARALRADPRSAPLIRGDGAPGRNRTCDRAFRRPLLYPLSYGGDKSPVYARRAVGDPTGRSSVIRGTARRRGARRPRRGSSSTARRPSRSR